MVTLLPVFVGVRRLAVATGVALLLGVTSCSSSSDQPRQLPPLSTTPVSTTSPAAVPDKKAALAEAEAVVREYFRAKNNLDRDVRAIQLANLVTPDCSCQELVRSARRLAHKGQHYFGAAHITGIHAVADSATNAEVVVTYDSTAGGTRDEDGRVIYRGSAHRGVTQNFYLRWDDSHWRIFNILLVDAGRRA
jgi:hypothetical protein